jgi:uncharacterized protein YaiI (UPF0178 family)
VTSVRILVDADACAVKDEVYKVAFRRAVPVTIVSNSRMRVPEHPLVQRMLVSGAFDAADDWIAEAADSKNDRHHRGHIARRPLPEGGRHGHRP